MSISQKVELVNILLANVLKSQRRAAHNPNDLHMETNRWTPVIRTEERNLLNFSIHDSEETNLRIKKVGRSVLAFIR